MDTSGSDMTQGKEPNHPMDPDPDPTVAIALSVDAKGKRPHSTWQQE